MSKNLKPTEPGWWWGKYQYDVIEGEIEPIKVTEIAGGGLAWSAQLDHGVVGSDERIEWIRPIPSPAELDELEAAARVSPTRLRKLLMRALDAGLREETLPEREAWAAVKGKLDKLQVAQAEMHGYDMAPLLDKFKEMARLAEKGALDDPDPLQTCEEPSKEEK